MFSFYLLFNFGCKINVFLSKKKNFTFVMIVKNLHNYHFVNYTTIINFFLLSF